ncbi:hypothetical protein A2239_04020 [Candidatus Uhrbacteria bacterium RIFOXYA2_FULL_40_9]|nr:MAG: hypothetical protein A2239_04020 [Candidatus Uhrbacteria bacterium RIFOXYA2_FULL_40_9]OGL97974.1 MAG: hypothetical protein A2332_00540 [Candidatus Uhrbacteria bacterium RIFOXYB2_FULL_41_18]
MEQEIITILNHFGFSEQEIDVYLAVLTLESPTVTQIASKVQKGRTAVYFHIKNLQEKGLLFESKKGSKLFYTALSPTEFANQIDAWARDFKTLVPKLESLQKVEQEAPTIELTESKVGYWKIYDEISQMPEGSNFRVLQGKQSLEIELSLLSDEQWTIFFDRIMKNNIGTIGLFTKETFEVPAKMMTPKNLERMQTRRWDLKTLPKSILDIQQLMFLYNNKVAFLFPETSLVMTIRHKGIYQILVATFDALHNLAESADPKSFTKG